MYAVGLNTFMMMCIVKTLLVLECGLTLTTSKDRDLSLSFDMYVYQFVCC